MDTQPETTASSFVYNHIPPKVSRKDFNRYIEPHLHRPKKGPKPKLSPSAIVNYPGYNGFCGSCSTPFIEPQTSKFSSQLSA
jgi:hypothetical protein